MIIKNIGNIIPHNWRGDIDLLNIVLLGLAEDLPEKAEKHELHRLLGALLSSKLKVDEKLDIIGNEFQIPLESDIRKDVSEMCNLSQGIEDRAYERGTADGLAKACLLYTSNVMNRMDEARETLQLANAYMSQLGRSINELQAKKLTDKKVLAMIDSLYPVSEDLSEMQKKNNLKQQETLKMCYFDAPDLQGVGKNGYRFINAVSDMAYHGKPLRQTKNYNENLFRKTIDGLPVLDKTYQMLLSA